jgi:hypothetical protein
MHPDPRSGYHERSSQSSDELLSVQGADTLHLMLHAREAHWHPPPITDAPHLGRRSLLWGTLLSSLFDQRINDGW